MSVANTPKGPSLRKTPSAYWRARNDCPALRTSSLRFDSEGPLRPLTHQYTEGAFPAEDPFGVLARPERFERPTLRFVV
jgi:hypothetical protein